MKNLVFVILLLLSLPSYAQSTDQEEILSRLIDLNAVDDDDYAGYEALGELLKDVEVVTLGDISHTDGTTFKTMVKLIKYLHLELGFEILAFESGLYGCDKAWEQIAAGDRADAALGRSIFGLWSESKEFMPLADHIQKFAGSDTPLMVQGFDSQITGNLAEETYIAELKSQIHLADSSILQTDDWNHLESSLTHHLSHDFKAIAQIDVSRDTTFINRLLATLQAERTSDMDDFPIRILINAKVMIADFASERPIRDRQMADNLMWIMSRFSNKKIICWGAGSHFMYNSQQIELEDEEVREEVGSYYAEVISMGHYLKEMLGPRLFTIGFTAYEGECGIWKTRKVEAAKSGSIEYILGESEYDNCLLPLYGLRLGALVSRPLSYQYMTTDISTVMDGLVFNRKMERPRANVPLVFELHPTYYWIAPDKKSKKIAKKAYRADKKAKREKRRRLRKSQ